MTVAPQYDDAAKSRAVEIASWLMRIAIVMHLCGIAWIIAASGGTAIGNIAFMEWDCDPQKVALIEKIVIAFFLAIGLTLLIRPTAIASLAIGCAVTLEVVAQYRFGGSPFISWVYWTSSLRYLLPFAFAIFIALPRDARWNRFRYPASAWIMRVGVAIVFISHGLQALYEHPRFIDLIIGSANRWIGYRPSQWQAVQALKVIGVVDVIVGILLMFGRWRWLLMEMATWGLVTALSRVTANGPLSGYEVLLRASHFLVPIALWHLAPVLDANAAAAQNKSRAATAPLLPDPQTT